jgi:hypothetical protein
MFVKKGILQQKNSKNKSNLNDRKNFKELKTFKDGNKTTKMEKKSVKYRTKT